MCPANEKGFIMQRLLCYQCGAPCDLEAAKYPTPLCPQCAKVKIAVRAAQRVKDKAKRAAEKQRGADNLSENPRSLAFKLKQERKARLRQRRIERKAKKAKVKPANIDDAERERRKEQGRKDKAEFRSRGKSDGCNATPRQKQISTIFTRPGERRAEIIP